MYSRRLRALLRSFALATGAACSIAGASAAEYPLRPIKMIVPFPPGGATDVVARQLAPAMSADLGQQIVIENRGGAGAIIGAEAVAKADPDGYTILASTAGVHVINPAIYSKLPYDPIKSFTPVSLLISAPLGVSVQEGSRFKNVQEMVAYARGNPGKLSFASAGNGTSLHQAGEMFKDALGVDILHVPYKGGGPAMTDMLGGRVDMIFGYVGSALPHIKAGKARMLAVGTPRRMGVIPDVPTVAEISGRPDFDSDTWTSIAGPPGLPAPIVDRLNRAAQRSLAENREKLVASGYVVLGGTPTELARRMERELRDLTPLLRRIMGPVGN